MSKVTDISEASPHLIIQTDDTVHVIPLSTLRDIANGPMGVWELDNWENIMPAIVKEWLGLLQK